jgi:glycosyltransferase involved in cell wall biosynthesis
VLFLNRSYWPDGEATGQLLTELTEDLASRFAVTVVAGHPNSNPSGETYNAFRSETRCGVRILRVPHTRLPKGWLPGRAINFITFLASATVRAVCCRRQDVVVVETDPFLLAFIGVLLRLRHRARLIVYLQDIHPDVGIAIGRLKENWLTRCLRKGLISSYHKADRVIVLSRDMRDTLTAYGVSADKISCVPNWTDSRRIRPSSGRNSFRKVAGIPESTFVVMYSGNLGVTQQLDHLIEVADRLRDEPDLLFVLIGGGSAEASLKAAVSERKLANVRFFPYQSREALGDSLSAADLHVIMVHPAALGFLMPSKLYGILAASRAIVAAVPASELAELIEQQRLGYVVPPGDLDAMASAIMTATRNRTETAAMGQRGRVLAEERFDRSHATRQFGDVIDDVSASTT